MASRRFRAITFGLIIALGLTLTAGVGGYLLWRPAPTAPVVGVVRATEIRVAPEVGGQLAAIKVEKGALVHVGDVVAELSALELTAAVEQARAALAEAVASRNHVYAGVRDEEIAALAAEIAKAKAGLTYAELQLTRKSELARRDYDTQQALDEAQKDVASARADVEEAEANYAAGKAGPTKEQLAIADAGVEAAAAALAVLQRRLEKTTLKAPADGVVTEVVAEVGEAIHAGQPVLAIKESGKQWLSFNVREDFLHSLTVGTRVDVLRQGAREATPAIITELLPLGQFATWQAERAVGDHDLNMLRLRIDLLGDRTNFEPGMTVWLSR
jgi:HlyD family secretion protein